MFLNRKPQEETPVHIMCFVFLICRLGWFLCLMAYQPSWVT